MICVSLQDNDLNRLKSRLTDLEMAEIRLDDTEFDLGDIQELFSGNTTTIATCRSGYHDDTERYRVMKASVSGGTNYVDLDLRNDPLFIKKVSQLVRNSDTGLIFSFHDYEECPDRKQLMKVIQDCFELGGNIAKIAVKVSSKRQCAMLLSLYETDYPGELISIGMGEIGKITRVASVFLGAPFTYAAFKAGMETASGQLDMESMKTALEVINSG